MLLALLLYTYISHAGSPVWLISKGDKHLYLGGTIHVLRPSDYPLPAVFNEAYKQTDIVVLETDLQKMSSPAFQQSLLKTVVYPADQTLKDHIAADTYKELESYLSSKGIPLANIVTLKPGMASISLSMIELQNQGFNEVGVDSYYNAKALNDKKTLLALETPEEQLDFINQMGVDNPDKLITYTLRDIKESPFKMDTLKDAWKSGNNEVLHALMLKYLRDDFPEIYNILLVRRNHNWLPKIETLFQSQEKAFILVGAMHLIGKDGLLALLKKKGYKVENL